MWVSSMMGELLDCLSRPSLFSVFMQISSSFPMFLILVLDTLKGLFRGKLNVVVLLGRW